MRPEVTPRLTRRALLLGTSRIAIVASLPMPAACLPPVKGEPWADDTFFSDGTGWLDDRWW